MFTLEIELGNAEMRTGEDVAAVLRNVADLCDNGYTSGPIGDDNGNAVGSWRLDGPEDEEDEESYAAGVEDEPAERLEYLRGEIRAERISQGELLELQNLADHIEPGDVELAEWAGIPEEEFKLRGN